MVWDNGIRDMKREREAVGSGPVKSYKMSSEELEDYLSRNEYKAPRNRDGEKIKQPVQHNSARPNMGSEEQARRTKMRDRGNGPDKQEFLKLIAEGKTIAAAEKEMGLSLNGIYYWVNKWNLKGITPENAKKLLGIAEPVEEQSAALPVALISVPEKVLKELREQIKDYENELARWVQIDSEKSLQLDEMQEDRDNWKQQAELYRSQRNDLENDRNDYIQACTEYEEERLMLLQTIEQASMPKPAVPHDNVNHPAHYTAGGIECIDAIEAAVSDLSGPLAYSTGAAIKYLWRYNRKNGLEDLQKAAWYVNRLIEEVGRLEQARTRANEVARTTA